MSEISEERLEELAAEFKQYDAPRLLELVAEIRRLRAENEELTEEIEGMRKAAAGPIVWNETELEQGSDQ